MKKGRMASSVLGLLLERDNTQLRLYDPVAKVRVPTFQETLAQARASHLAEVEARREATKARKQAEVQRDAEAKAREAAEAENEKLRLEIARLRGEE